MKKAIKKIFIYTIVLVIAFLQTGCFFLNLFLPFEPLPSSDIKRPTKVEIVFPDGNFSKTNESVVRSCLVVVDDGKLNANDYEIEWKINGQQTNESGATYVFFPSDEAKEISVSATLNYRDNKGANKTFSDTKRFVYCNQINEVSVVETVSDTAVSYSIENVDENLNVIEWYVGGKYESSGVNFNFQPSLGGIYQIRLKVNGNQIPLENSTVNISGMSQIKDLNVDFDTYYPNVKISWSGQKYDGEYKVVVKTSTLEETYFTYENELILTQEQFPLDAFDVTVNVQAMGNSNITASEVVSQTTLKLSAIERQYLGTDYGIENAYVMDDDEFFIQFDFMMLSREQPTSNQETRLTRSFYMAYDFGDIDELCSYAFDKSAYAGNYRLGANTVGNVATVDICFKTVNEPIENETPIVPSSYNSNLNGYKPYQKEVVTRLESLPIDEKEPIEVTTTDMLYRVAEMGYQPLPKEGSRAQIYYAYARDLLYNVIDANATDYEVALTLYDWLIHTNNYNNSVTELEIEEAVKSVAFYIEGVLNPNYSYGVCDGIAKTYSLLCNMMGIECLRVTGIAGAGESKGGHAWNKIKIDENWYVVDATWGDQTLTLEYRESALPITIKRTFELGIHSYFLTTDANISTTHVEDDYGYPTSHYIPYPHFRQKSSGNYDWYLNESGVKLRDAVSEISSRITNSLSVINTFDAYGSPVSSNFFLFEIGYCEGNKEEVFRQFSQTSTIVSSIKQKGYYYEMFEINSTIVIIVSKRCRLQDKLL